MMYPYPAANPAQNGYANYPQPQMPPPVAPAYGGVHNPYEDYNARLARLQAQQMQAQGQVGNPQQAQAQQAQPPQSMVMGVNNEQSARDYPLDLSGTPQLFVLKDESESKIFAKRFNTANAQTEFAVYHKELPPTPIKSADGSEGINTGFMEVVGKFTAQLTDIQTDIQGLRDEVKNLRDGKNSAATSKKFASDTVNMFQKDDKEKS